MLEAYKLSLVAAAEHAKAAQAVRTAAALRVAELKFKALDDLSRATRDIAAKTMSYVGVSVADQQVYMKYRQEFSDRLKRVDEAAAGSANFVTGPEYMLLLNLQREVLRVGTLSTGPGFALEANVLAVEQQNLAQRQIVVDSMIRRHFEEMSRLDGDSAPAAQANAV